MLSARRILAGLIVTCACLSPLLAGGNANFIFPGVRFLDDGRFWGDLELDAQGVIGVNVDFGPQSWPVNLALSAMASSAENTIETILPSSGELVEADFTARIRELGIGVNKTWGQGKKTRPFISGGIALVTAELDVESVKDDGSGAGLFIDGGVFWRLGKRFNIGVDARIVLGTEVTIFRVKTDTDYAQLGLILGFGWGD